MSKLKSVFVTLLVSVMTLSFLVEDNDNRITWSPSIRIQWQDFHGHPDYGDSFRDVVTASSINYAMVCLHDDTMVVSVKADFIKDQSWVKEVARTDYHLGHERLHFDITELYVRKLRKEFSNKSFVCGQEAEINGLAEAVLLEWRTFQQRYDKYTYYSLNHSAQRKWESEVAKQLIELDDFASI